MGKWSEGVGMSRTRSCLMYSAPPRFIQIKSITDLPVAEQKVKLADHKYSASNKPLDCSRSRRTPKKGAEASPTTTSGEDSSRRDEFEDCQSKCSTDHSSESSYYFSFDFKNFNSLSLSSSESTLCDQREEFRRSGGGVLIVCRITLNVAPLGFDIILQLFPQVEIGTLADTSQNVSFVSERLVKAKSDESLISITSSMNPHMCKVKSRSLELLTGIATWNTQPQIVELIKGEKGLGFSILDYQVIQNILQLYIRRKIIVDDYYHINTWIIFQNHKQNLDDSANSSLLNLPDDQQIQSPITESNVEVLSSLPEAADESINIADIAVVCEEDFDILLKNMEINIRSTLHKEEQNQKIYRVNQMLNDINNHENNFGVASKVGDLSIYLSRSRGRNRGRKNRVIGLPASKRNYSIKSFDELREGQKKKYILKLMFDDEDFIEDIILRMKKIELSNLNYVQLNMPDALSSETINLNIVQVYFEDDAFQHLNKLIKLKRHNNTNWTCYSCKNNLDTDDSVECDKCLFWNHWACVELTEAPLNDWFCPKCKLENNN
ncbi:uncharacterized protein LOC123265079 [Cotesia glomerata]|uniref:uncharacterized protein LOC123265079 n=1 Tax=Cotesia glomerata TaxID=32391 RepID=UPI001D00CA4F|nr:uncharacterized protein LOC123265079 [Cotesia glomerata]